MQVSTVLWQLPFLFSRCDALPATALSLDANEHFLAAILEMRQLRKCVFIFALCLPLSHIFCSTVPKSLLASQPNAAENKVLHALQGTCETVQAVLAEVRLCCVSCFNQ